MQAVMIERRLRAPVTPSDRLAATLCLAVIVHAMIVLGITFTPETPHKRVAEGLEITLVTQKSLRRPDHADRLAQVNAEGGGHEAHKANPATPIVAPIPAPTAEIAATTKASDTPTPEPRLPVDPMMRPPTPKQQTSDHTHKATPPKQVKQTKLAQAELPAQPTLQAETKAEPAVAPTPAPEVAAAPTQDAPAELPSAAQLITRSFALASLHAELEQKLDMRAQRPRLKFVSATTQEYRYAAYMEAWRAKVERIGNINYPDEARQKKLSGALLLDVALRPDGSVLEVIVRRSSGHKVLDDAAVRIVELASPYAEFPEEIRRDVDILHITRTWKFLSNESFSAQ